MALDLAPRAAVERKSGSLDFPDRYKTRIERFRFSSRDQAMRQLEENKEWGNIARYIAALEGKYWDRTRPGYRSRFTDNQIARARKEKLAMYTDVRPTINVASENKNYAPLGILLSQIMISEWTHRGTSDRLTEVIDHAMFGTGYWKINTGPGMVVARACGMDTVLPINATSDLQEASALLYRTFKPMSYFQLKYEQKAAAVARSIRNTARAGDDTFNYGMMMTEYTWDRLSPAMRKLMKNRRPPRATDGGDDVFPVAELEELWFEDMTRNETGREVIVKHPSLPTTRHNYWYRVQPGQRLFPKKRLMVFGGDELLYDGPTPHWTSQYPFSRLALDPVVWAPGGLSNYRVLLPLNEGINEIGAGVFDTIKKAINQTYAYKQGSVKDADWDRFFPDMPGAKLRMTPIGDPQRDIRPIPPPELPAYVREFLMQYILPVFDRHAGTMDVNSISKKKQVPGGDTLQQLQDAQSGPQRLEGRRIEAFLESSGQIAVSHILQNFNLRERFHRFGKEGVTDEDFEGQIGSMVPAGQAAQSFWTNLQVKVTPGSIHGQQKDREQNKAVAMFKSGALSLKTLLSKFEIPDVEGEMEQIKKEREAGITGGQPAGRTERQSRGQRNAKIA